MDRFHARINALAEGTVHTWGIALYEAAHLVAPRLGLLDDRERERAEAMATLRLKERFVLAHGGLRQVLAGYAGVSPAELRFVTGPHGKPALPNRPPLSVSISRTQVTWRSSR